MLKVLAQKPLKTTPKVSEMMAKESNCIQNKGPESDKRAQKPTISHALGGPGGCWMSVCEFFVKAFQPGLFYVQHAVHFPGLVPAT